MQAGNSGLALLTLDQAPKSSHLKWKIRNALQSLAVLCWCWGVRQNGFPLAQVDKSCRHVTHRETLTFCLTNPPGRWSTMGTLLPNMNQSLIQQTFLHASLAHLSLADCIKSEIFSICFTLKYFISFRQYL